MLDSTMIGRNLGPYRIVSVIGRGGMAEVYKAYEPGLDRYVAIKVLLPMLASEAGFAVRFDREAKAIARLDHRNILPVYSFGQQDGFPYLVMRYVQAGTLKALLGKPLDLPYVAEIIHQVGSALGYAHRSGIIHRDIKPSNILMADEHWALLTDFGLARMMESASHLTGTGVGIGTPAYMSPEQAQGLVVDARTDVYALGVMLYEMVTGRVPYDAETPMAVVMKHISAPLPIPSQVVPGLPEPVERVILKSLAKDPADRFQSADELVKALDQVVQELAKQATAISTPLPVQQPGSAPTPSTPPVAIPSDLSPLSKQQAEMAPIFDAPVLPPPVEAQERPASTPKVEAQAAAGLQAESLGALPTQLIQKAAEAQTVTQTPEERPVEQPVEPLPPVVEVQTVTNVPVMNASATETQVSEGPATETQVSDAPATEAPEERLKPPATPPVPSIGEAETVTDLPSETPEFRSTLLTQKEEEVQTVTDLVQEPAVSIPSQPSPGQAVPPQARTGAEPGPLPSTPARKKSLPVWAWVGGLVILCLVVVVSGFLLRGGMKGFIFRQNSPTAVSQVEESTPTQSLSAQQPTLTKPLPSTNTPIPTLIGFSMRIRLVTTSDWTTLTLENPNAILSNKAIKVEGVVTASGRDGQSTTFRVNQDIGRALAGHQVVLEEELVLDPNRVAEKMAFVLDSGCAGVSEVFIYNAKVNPPTLVQHEIYTLCNTPVNFQVKAWDLESITPPAALQTGPSRPMLPDALDTDNSKIVFVCDEVKPPQLCVRSVRSGKVTQLTRDLKYFNLLWPAWTQDGQWIYFRAQAKQDGPWYLYNVRSDGAGGGPVIAGGDDVWYAEFSPDMQTIAFTRDCRVLRFMRPDGTQRRAVDVAGAPCIVNLNWSPDGSQMTFVDFSTPSPGPSVWVMNSDGSHPNKIYQFPQPKIDWAVAVWSPDAKSIGVWYALPQSRWQAILLDSAGRFDPEPIDWEIPPWWGGNFYPRWGK